MLRKFQAFAKLADKAPDLDVEKISGSLQKLKDKATASKQGWQSGCRQGTTSL